MSLCPAARSGRIALGGKGLLLASFLALGLIFVLNVPFLRLLGVHGGPAVGTLGAGLLLIELLAAGVGSAYGIATFIAGKKY